MRAYISYQRRDVEIYFWRSRDCEVDLIIGNDIAIEIKFAEKIKNDLFSGLRALKQENIHKKFYLVGRFRDGGEFQGCQFLNWKVFLDQLWNNDIF